MAKLTAVRRQILENIQHGRDPYTGLEGSRYGGAFRSVQSWRGIFDLLEERKDEGLVLTDKGVKALETGEY
jgi:hypothetical protein